jgi:membrane-associated phospholipid phosphatase
VPAPTSGLDDVRTLTLRLLFVYVTASTLTHSWNLARGAGDTGVAIVQALLIAAIVASMRSRHWAWRRAGDWLPMLSLPVLYATMQWSKLGGGGMHDGVVQGWDRLLFGTDPARSMAGALPWLPFSELLHLAYFSYYAIIYAPALFLYLSADDQGAFRSLVLAFTVAMIASFAVFIVFPVEGPRYAWAAPPGIPDGPVRRLVLSVLEAGSTRGTAFPSSHVAIALAIGLAAFAWRRAVGAMLLATTVLLGVGAVYGGFHYAADVLAGAALGVGCWGISRGLERRSLDAGPGAGERGLP